MSEVTETVEPQLRDFMSRLHTERQRMESIAGWHLRAYQEGGIELPWSVDSTWNNTNVYVKDTSEGAKPYATVLDMELSRQKLAQVAKFATKQVGVVVTKNYDDADFELKVQIPSLDESTTFEITYYVKREAVCTKKVVGYEEVAERIIPAQKKEIVEWECEPVSLLKIAEHSK